MNFIFRDSPFLDKHYEEYYQREDEINDFLFIKIIKIKLYFNLVIRRMFIWVYK